MYNYYKMSAETLKFFENQTTEQIINWMLVHLSEDQIKMCLDASGIPDTTNAPRSVSGKQPMIQPVVPQQVPIQRPFGEGSSTDQQPPGLRPNRVEDAFLKKFRTKCASTSYVIKSVRKEGVLYFEFKEVEPGDDTMELNIPVYSVGWVKKLTPISEFSTFCTEADKAFLEILKEDNNAAFLNAPVEVIQTAADYPSTGLPSPIPIVAQVPIVPDVPDVPVVQEELMTDNMLKAIRIQQASNKIMSDSYPLLFSKRLTMYPIFVYNSDGDNVMHLSAIFKDGRIQFKQDSTNVKILNSKFRKITSDINEAVRTGLYIPSEDIRKELNLALRDIQSDIALRISEIYRPIYVNNFTYFGSLEDEDEDDFTDYGVTPGDFTDYGEHAYEDTNIYSDEDENMDYTDNYPTDSTLLPEDDTTDDVPGKSMFGRKMKPSEMSIEELENRMITQYSPEFARKFKPEKYTNALGHTTVRYVKRTDCPECPACPEYKPSVFADFGTASSEEELLFN